MKEMSSSLAKHLETGKAMRPRVRPSLRPSSIIHDADKCGDVYCVGPCRVNGNLNLSRAIGDLRYKGNLQLRPADQIITAEPDIIEVISMPLPGPPHPHFASDVYCEWVV
jgi:hypothetical protein